MNSNHLCKLFQKPFKSLYLGQIQWQKKETMHVSWSNLCTDSNQQKSWCKIMCTLTTGVGLNSENKDQESMIGWWNYKGNGNKLSPFLKVGEWDICLIFHHGSLQFKYSVVIADWPLLFFRHAEVHKLSGYFSLYSHTFGFRPSRVPLKNLWIHR